MGGRGMSGGGMMGGGRMGAVGHAMSHSAMSTMGVGGMMGGRGMMGGGGMMGGNATAQEFTNTQIASVSSGMGIAGMMGNRGMMDGQRSSAYTNLENKFNNLQTKFDDLQNSQGQGLAGNFIEPQFAESQEEKTTPINTESSMPFAGYSSTYSSTSINVGAPNVGTSNVGTQNGDLGPNPFTSQTSYVKPGDTQPPAFTPPVKLEPTVSTTPKPGSGTGPTGFTGYQPFTLQDYAPLKVPVSQKQQIYTSKGGQGFYGSPQVTPTNPFTGAAYALDENGLPKYNNIYGPGTTIPGQVLPTKRGGSLGGL